MHDTKKKKTFLQRKCALVFVCSHNYNYTIYEEFQIKKSNFKAKVSFAILLVKCQTILEILRDCYLTVGHDYFLLFLALRG